MHISEAVIAAREAHAEHDLMRDLEFLGQQKFEGIVRERVAQFHDFAEYKIWTEIISHDPKGIYSIVTRYPERARLIIADGQRHCWKRFCFVKELCHLYHNHRQSFSGKACELEVAAREGRTAIFSPDEELNAESFNFFTAIELMVPSSIRPEIRKMESEGGTSYQIASKLRIPKVFLETYFLGDAEYAKISDSI